MTPSTNCGYSKIDFDGIREYIVAHYQLSQRDDTDYWRDNRINNHVPQIFSDIRDAWDLGEDVEKILTKHQSELVYLRPSWYCIFAGMGRFPSDFKPTQYGANVEEAKQYCRETVRRYFAP